MHILPDLFIEWNKTVRMRYTMARTKSKKTERASSESPAAALFLGSCVGAGIAFLLSLLLSLLSSMICISLSDPLAPARVIGMGIAFLCYLIAGILSKKRSDASSLPAGLCSGCFFSLCLLLSGWLLSGSAPTAIGWLRMLLGVGFSILGACLFGKSPQVSRRKRRKGHGR